MFSMLVSNQELVLDQQKEYYGRTVSLYSGSFPVEERVRIYKILIKYLSRLFVNSSYEAKIIQIILVSCFLFT